MGGRVCGSVWVRKCHLGSGEIGERPRDWNQRDQGSNPSLDTSVRA